MWLPWEAGVKLYPKKGGSLYLGQCLIFKLYGDFFFWGGEGENCGLCLHFADLNTSVICPLLYLVHSFLDPVSNICGVFRCVPHDEMELETCWASTVVMLIYSQKNVGEITPSCWTQGWESSSFHQKPSFLMAPRVILEVYLNLGRTFLCVYVHYDHGLLTPCTLATIVSDILSQFILSWVGLKAYHLKMAHAYILWKLASGGLKGIFLAPE